MSFKAAFIVDLDSDSARAEVSAALATKQTGFAVNQGNIEEKCVVQSSTATLARAEVSMQTDEPFESTHLVSNFA